MRLFRVSVRIHSVSGVRESRRLVRAWDEGQAEALVRYDIAAEYKFAKLAGVDVLGIEEVEGEDVRMRRLDAPMLPLYEV